METTTTGKIATTGFDFVMYLVRDVQAARAFYEGVFALTPGAFDSDGFVEYDLPDGNTFALGSAPGGAHVQCGGLMFAVPDVDAAIERVKAHGGAFFKKYGGEICDSGWCSDLDGNPFGVHKRKASA
jgi:predicted enzyme related to lactoylglutathione lyase